MGQLAANPFNPALNRFIAQTARTQARTQRFVQVVRDAMQRTGSVQVELNPCDVWTPEELVAAARAAREPLSLQLGGRNFFVSLKEIRVRCPSTAIEWDYDLRWTGLHGGADPTGTVTLLGDHVMVGSLDSAMQRPVHASICYRNFRILRIDLSRDLELQYGLEAVRGVPNSLLREASALPLCVNMLGRPVIGIGG